MNDSLKRPDDERTRTEQIFACSIDDIEERLKEKNISPVDEDNIALLKKNYVKNFTSTTQKSRIQESLRSCYANGRFHCGQACIWAMGYYGYFHDELDTEEFFFGADVFWEDLRVGDEDSESFIANIVALHALSADDDVILHLNNAYSNLKNRFRSQVQSDIQASSLLQEVCY